MGKGGGRELGLFKACESCLVYSLGKCRDGGGRGGGGGVVGRMLMLFVLVSFSVIPGSKLLRVFSEALSMALGLGRAVNRPQQFWCRLVEMLIGPHA